MPRFRYVPGPECLKLLRNRIRLGSGRIVSFSGGLDSDGELIKVILVLYRLSKFRIHKQKLGVEGFLSLGVSGLAGAGVGVCGLDTYSTYLFI